MVVLISIASSDVPAGLFGVLGMLSRIAVNESICQQAETRDQ